MPLVPHDVKGVPGAPPFAVKSVTPPTQQFKSIRKEKTPDSTKLRSKDSRKSEKSKRKNLDSDEEDLSQKCPRQNHVPKVMSGQDLLRDLTRNLSLEAPQQEVTSTAEDPTPDLNLL